MSMVCIVLLVSGEEVHARGADGARRAKFQLESTGRANVLWLQPDKIAVSKLTFEWANGGTFSFDMGGVLRGEGIDGLEFLGESKAYKNASDQGVHYRKYLAQCYRAFQLRPDRCDRFYWITSSPFLVNSWGELQTSDWVRNSVLAHHDKVFATSLEDEARELVSDKTCKEVAERLKFYFLSDGLEELTLTKEHLGLIRNYDTMKEGQ
jgi:hypothetical protein